MRITDTEALDLLQSEDLIGVGMRADQIRRNLHPGNVASYIIDRNINYTNFCTEYCSFCAFYRPMGHSEGYVLNREQLHQKIQETIDLGGTGVLMQGGLHPDLKIEWYEDLMRDLIRIVAPGQAHQRLRVLIAEFAHFGVIVTRPPYGEQNHRDLRPGDVRFEHRVRTVFRDIEPTDIAELQGFLERRDVLRSAVPADQHHFFTA